ncbi:hypothetical protein OA93_02050 [Flavobacterium sp. KMS]|uniref:hypothetical protein n=1 Tax=Flavobacterium sp. KMS TaxID=1566023 RepID=UPI00057EA4C3|nr:hypothetical protein [Flavobacterium sp. KMS]KIC00404.1 hypothetical protein OA93_02050 [Flavobacterium sp. KMS]
MKILVIISILLFSISCKNKEIKPVKKIDNSKKIEKTISENKNKSDTTDIKDYQNEVMNEKDILFNGRLKRYFTLSEFEKVFGENDSIKLVLEEGPCYSIFENEDGSVDPEDKYLYKDGSRFENSKDKVAVDEFRFTKSNFILFKGIKLKSTTSISDLQKLFPNATKDIGKMDVYGEGKLEVIQLREDENNASSGHIKIFIKNDKLYFMHWWFPC